MKIEIKVGGELRDALTFYIACLFIYIFSKGRFVLQFITTAGDLFNCNMIFIVSQ